MSEQKTADELLGGAPLVTSAPEGQPSESRFIGRRDTVNAGNINRGLYSVAAQVDRLRAAYNQLARKAVTSSTQKRFEIVDAPQHLFNQVASDDVLLSAYTGVDPSNSPSAVMDVFRPGTTSQYQENTESVFTVFEISAGAPVLDVAGDVVVAFQIRTLTGYSGVTRVKFIQGAGALAVAVVVAVDDIDITVTYDIANSDTFADVAAAINANGNANTRVEAVGTAAVVKDHTAVNTADNVGTFFVPLEGKASVDASIDGAFIDDPATGVDLPFPTRALAKYVSADTALEIIASDLTSAQGWQVGDYVLVTAHPTQEIAAAYSPTGRHAVHKVTAVTSATPDIAHATADQLVIEDFTLLADMGYASVLGELDDEEQVYFTISRYQAEYWAVGHQHYFDTPAETEVNPLPFEYGSDLDVRWFQGHNGPIVTDFATDRNNIIRTAALKTAFLETVAAAAPEDITDTDINETVTVPGKLLYDGSAASLQLLVQPRFAGSAAAIPKFTLADVRFVFSETLDSATTLSIALSYSSDAADAFSAVVTDTFTAAFEQVGVDGDGYPIYRVDPFSVVDGAATATTLPEVNTVFFYRVTVAAAAAEGDPKNTRLRSVYSSGAFAGSAVLAMESPTVLVGDETRAFTYTDVEIWIEHEVGDPGTGIENIVLDLYSSSTGSAGSYSLIKRGVDLELSHKVASTPFKNIFAYRARVFPEGFEFLVSATKPRSYLMTHVIQPGTASTHNRLVNVALVNAHKNSAYQRGAFVGASMTGIGLEPTITLVEVEALTRRTSVDGLAGGVLTDTGVTDFTVEAAVGDWLRIVEAGTVSGNHRIDAVAAQALTLATPAFALPADAGPITYEIYRGGNPLFPVGVEGGSRNFYLISNVDIVGEASEVDISLGSFARLEDAAPDAFRSSPGSFGDTGFLTQKLAEVMGTSVSDAVPSSRNLVNLDQRIQQLTVVTVGLGTSTPRSIGQFNVSDYASVNATITTAIASLPAEGGIIELKTGVYGDGSDNNGGALASNKWTDNLYVDAANVILRAEAKGAVEFLLDKDVVFAGPAATESVNVVLRADDVALIDVVVDSSTTNNPTDGVGFDPSAVEGSVWVGGTDGAGVPVIDPYQGIVVQGLDFKRQANLVLGYPGAAGQLQNSLTSLTLSALDFNACTEANAIYTDIGTLADPADPVADETQFFDLRISNVKTYVETQAMASGDVPAPTTASKIRLAQVYGGLLADVKGSIYAEACYLLGVIGGTMVASEFVDCTDSVVAASKYVEDLTLRTLDPGKAAHNVVCAGGPMVSRKAYAVGEGHITITDYSAVALSDFSIRPVGDGVDLHSVVISGSSDVVVDSIHTTGRGGLSADTVAGIRVSGLVISGSDTGGERTDPPVLVDACTDVSIGDVRVVMGTLGTPYYASDLLVSVNGGADVSLRKIRATGRSADLTLGAADPVDGIDLTDVDIGAGTITRHASNVDEVLVNIRSAQRVFAEIPSGAVLAAQGSDVFTDGKEIQRLGIRGDKTLRMWSDGADAYMTHNVSAFTVSAGEVSAATREDAAEGAAVIRIGSDNTLWTIDTVGVILRALSAENGASAVGINDIASVLIRNRVAVTDHALTSGIRTYQTADALVIASNLEFLGTPADSWTGSTIWSRVVPASTAGALVVTVSGATYSCFVSADGLDPDIDLADFINITSDKLLISNSVAYLAASNSSAADKARAVAVCTGTGDQGTIATYLALYPDVVLLDGTYTFDSSLAIPANKTLRGTYAGKPSIASSPLARVYWHTTSGAGPMITVGVGGSLQGLYINGGPSTGNNPGQALTDVVVASDSAKVNMCFFTRARSTILAAAATCEITNNFFYLQFDDAGVGAGSASFVELSGDDILFSENYVYWRAYANTRNNYRAVRVDGHYTHIVKNKFHVEASSHQMQDAECIRSTGISTVVQGNVFVSLLAVGSSFKAMYISGDYAGVHNNRLRGSGAVPLAVICDSSYCSMTGNKGLDFILRADSSAGVAVSGNSGFVLAINTCTYASVSGNAIVEVAAFSGANCACTGNAIALMSSFTATNSTFVGNVTNVVPAPPSGSVVANNT